MNSLFGVELPTSVNFVIAFAVVLGLIAAAAWLVRRFGAARLDATGRSRQPRLAVIDSAAVDGRRKLVIIRRDNVEHLLMIGGPTDVVVETNIIRSPAASARDTPGARNGAAEAVPRAVAAPEPTPWPLQPEPAPAHALRADRGPYAAADDAPHHWPTSSEAAGVPVPPVRATRPADAPVPRAGCFAAGSARRTGLRRGDTASHRCDRRAGRAADRSGPRRNGAAARSRAAASDRKESCS
jgi:flagellar protein FliO/FliZ